MVLEMRRALEQLKKGEEQGYRKLYDALGITPIPSCRRNVSRNCAVDV